MPGPHGSGRTWPLPRALLRALPALGPAGAALRAGGPRAPRAYGRRVDRSRGSRRFCLPTPVCVSLCSLAGVLKVSWQPRSAGSGFWQSLPLAPHPALCLQPGSRRPAPRIRTLLFAAHLPSLPQRRACGSRHTREAGPLQPHAAQLRGRWVPHGPCPVGSSCMETPNDCLEHEFMLE